MNVAVSRDSIYHKNDLLVASLAKGWLVGLIKFSEVLLQVCRDAHQTSHSEQVSIS